MNNYGLTDRDTTKRRKVGQRLGIGVVWVKMVDRRSLKIRRLTQLIAADVSSMSDPPPGQSWMKTCGRTPQRTPACHQDLAHPPVLPRSDQQPPLQDTNNIGGQESVGLVHA